MRDDLVQTLLEVRDTFPTIDLRDRRVFIANLAFVYQVIAATEDLLKEAAANSFGPLAQFYREHLEEETDHAAWLAEDLESAGMKVWDLPLSPDAVAMAGSQYYLIRLREPLALLGYMAVLECFPMSMKHVEALELVHGKKLCRTLRHHAEHDVDHGEDVLKHIDGLGAREYALVKQNAVQTSLYLRAAIAKFGGDHAG